MAAVEQRESAAQDCDSEIGDRRNHGTIKYSREPSQSINAGDDPQADERKSEQTPFAPAEKRSDCRDFPGPSLEWVTKNVPSDEAGEPDDFARNP